MRFMILVKERPPGEAAARPDERQLAAMADFHEQLAQAGVLLDCSGLQPSAKGWRILHAADGRRSVVDGPFPEAGEAVAGYTLIQVRSREEALEWTRRFPSPHGEGVAAEIEVRPLCEFEDFAPCEAAGRFHEPAPAARRSVP